MLRLDGTWAGEPHQDHGEHEHRRASSFPGWPDDHLGGRSSADFRVDDGRHLG